MAKKEKKSGRKDERGLAAEQNKMTAPKETETKTKKNRPGLRQLPTGRKTAGMG
jgi:hypothetical protein